MHLLSLLALSSLVFTGLALDTDNEKICKPNDDKNTCTVTVVRNRDHVMPGQPETDDKTWIYILDNACNSIIKSDDCNSEREPGTLCKQNIGEDDSNVELWAKGKASTFFVSGKGDGDGLQDAPPIFSVMYGSGDPISDEEGSDDPCTCAQSVHDLVDDQVCACSVSCGD